MKLKWYRPVCTSVRLYLYYETEIFFWPQLYILYSIHVYIKYWTSLVFCASKKAILYCNAILLACLRIWFLLSFLHIMLTVVQLLQYSLTCNFKCWLQAPVVSSSYGTLGHTNRSHQELLYCKYCQGMLYLFHQMLLLNNSHSRLLTMRISLLSKIVVATFVYDG